MPQKGFRDNYFKLTRYNREFTVGRMCRDFFRIEEFIKIVFVLAIFTRMIYLGEQIRFILLIFILGFSNKLFYFLVDKFLKKN